MKTRTKVLLKAAEFVHSDENPTHYFWTAINHATGEVLVRNKGSGFSNPILYHRGQEYAAWLQEYMCLCCGQDDEIVSWPREDRVMFLLLMAEVSETDPAI